MDEVLEFKHGHRLSKFTLSTECWLLNCEKDSLHLGHGDNVWANLSSMIAKQVFQSKQGQCYLDFLRDKTMGIMDPCSTSRTLCSYGSFLIFLVHGG